MGSFEAALMMTLALASRTVAGVVAVTEDLIESVEGQKENHGRISPDRGSNDACLVGRVGFEPTKA